MLEEVAVASELLVVVPAVVLGVAALVVLVFWIGSGRQRSFEEVKALASKRADEALREREKFQQGGKKKKPFVRRKPAKGSGGEEEEQPTPGGKGAEPPEPALKPILKGSGGKPPVAAAAASPTGAGGAGASPERTPKVDFHLEEMKTPKPAEKKSVLVRTVTPHPSALKQKAALARRAVEEDDDLGGELVVIRDGSPPLVEKPKPKPSAPQQAPPKAPPTTGKSSAGGQKKRQRQRQAAELGELAVMGRLAAKEGSAWRQLGKQSTKETCQLCIPHTMRDPLFSKQVITWLLEGVYCTV